MLNVSYQFRNPAKSREFDYLAPNLQKMFYLLCHILNDMSYDVIITSMLRLPDTIDGESGVHSTGRAIDCIPLRRSDVNIVETSQDYDTKMKIVADCINKMLPRADGKSTIIWHQFPGGNGLHFHTQVPYNVNYKDLKGIIPLTDA